jgi:carbon monoxide dehydrogenase subunit G
MTELSYFESSWGKVNCSAEEVFCFVTDIRNFERFIPVGTIINWNAEKESCSFTVSMLGTVKIKLTEREKFTRVTFTGDALNKEDFSLTLLINGRDKNSSDIKINLSAELNPIMKMMASEPIGRFLEKLIREMENFRDWDGTK